MASNETAIYTALLIAASAIGMILTFFVISLLSQHRKNVRLHREKLLAEINTLEKERVRVASDLHDEIGPVLSAIKLQINSLDSKEPGDEALINNAGRYIDEVMIKIREISNNLMPGILTRKGLVAAITDLAEKISRSSGVNITFVCKGSEELLLKEKRIHLYRIIQEIIHNNIKHSGASVLDISLNISNKLLLLDAKDNGRGFDQKNVSKDNNGSGLKNILSRVELLGGVMYLDTEPGNGVSFSIEIPAI